MLTILSFISASSEIGLCGARDVLGFSVSGLIRQMARYLTGVPRIPKQNTRVWRAQRGQSESAKAPRVV